MFKTYILGNGGFAQEVFEQIFLNEPGKLEFGGFIIIKKDKAHVINDDGVKLFNYDKQSNFIIGTSNYEWRKIFINHITRFYEINAVHFPNIQAYNAHLSGTGMQGVGNLFLCYSMMNANTDIGNFNTFNCYSSIHHDTTVGDNNFFAAYASAVPNRRIGDNNILQPGEVLYEDMEDNEILSSGVVHDGDLLKP